ncbi:hypothetical protein N656DRAFT_796331 [Canariomyces notabilis]|uniref:Uncharacterized protein n=1 Tax=Canariomyces notabilis TaxID=2074819 RepID=A0AAN6TIV5_9PEZI|nr:hypothetical protein N656DRAFT_796331 [Canariomyces arenarius]
MTQSKHKPLRQLAAEKVRGEGANPSQLGDPSDLKAETSDGPDPDQNTRQGEPTSASSGKTSSSSLGAGRQKNLPDTGDPDRGNPFVSGGGVKVGERIR